MNCSAVLFDLDGTLLDTAPEFETCLNTLLQQEGKSPIALADLKSWVSFGARGMLKFGFKLSEQDPYLEELLPQFLALYQDNIGFQTKFFPGMANILTLINSKEIPWAIVTNKPLKFTLPLVEKFELLRKATCVVAGDSLPVQKPDAAPLLHACQQLAVNPQHCWYIGDARTDVQASKNANMRCAIANYGYIPIGETSTNWEADDYLERPEDIQRLLLA